MRATASGVVHGLVQGCLSRGRLVRAAQAFPAVAGRGTQLTAPGPLCRGQPAFSSPVVLGTTPGVCRGRQTVKRAVLAPLAAQTALPPAAGEGVEMGGLAYLLSLCAVMFLGGYGAGMLPLVVQISEARLRLVTAFGAGLLVGTALAVIIPEGFAALEEAGSTSHSAPGATLIAGFLTMLLLDNLQGHSHASKAHSSSPASSPRASGPSEQDIDGFVALEVSTSQHSSSNQDPAFRALVGLIIHSAADGFAVGTATTSDNVMLSTMVGAAMVMHKAPVAFGLATYLLSAKWTWQRANKGIFVFSVASPVTAMVTYGVLRHIPMLSTPLAIALCVLFSGGTFLYASCIHILPEVKGKNGSFSRGQLAGIVIGSLIPLFLASFHTHGGGGHDHHGL